MVSVLAKPHFGHVSTDSCTKSLIVMAPIRIGGTGSSGHSPGCRPRRKSRQSNSNKVDPCGSTHAYGKRRPAEVSGAIDAVGQDARFAPLLALDKVGVFGMSAGGHTGLSLAGGRWSPALLKAHCEADIAEDFQSCVGVMARLNGGFLDGMKKAIALPRIPRGFD